MIIIKNKDIYFNLIKDFEHVPFTQSRGWYDFNDCDRAGRALFLTNNRETPEIACYGHIKEKIGLKLLLIEGECFKKKEYNHKVVQTFFEEIKQLGYDIIELNSNSIYNAEYEIGIRRAGFLKPVGQFSIQLSSRIHLQEAIVYDKNWRKNLKKAHALQLHFELVSQPTMNDAIIIYKQYQELLNRKRFGENLSIKQLTELIKDPTIQVAYCKKNEQIIASIVFYKREHEAITIFRTTSLEGRKLSAAYFLYEQLISYLRNLQFVFYDMNKLSPSTHSKDSVFTFKNGIKGEYINYNGEWSWYKIPIYRPMMYLVKKYLFNKIEV